MINTSRATEYTVGWILTMGHEHQMKKCKDVVELKKWVAAKFGSLSENQKKGLKLMNWDAIYQLLQKS